ncbi:MAG: response regulator [Verrucomicrobiales bacterium]|nr:response regulator [Verrucomicrobiales bacterium]
MNTIRHRLLLVMLITGFVPVVLVLIPLVTVLARDLRRSEEGKISDIARRVGQHVAEVMDRTARDLETLVTNPFFADPQGDMDRKLGEMERLVTIHDTYFDLSLYNKDGFLLTSTTDNHPSYRDYSDWFKSALKGEIAVSLPHKIVGKENSLFLSVFLPVRSKDGGVDQVIKARLSFERVMELLRGNKIGDSGAIYLIDAWGNVICGSDELVLMEKFDGEVPVVRWVREPIGTYRDAHGEEFLYGAETLPGAATHVGSHWVVLAIKPIREVDAVMNRTMSVLITATIIMVGVATALGWYFSRRLSVPLERLGAVARRIAGGEQSVRAEKVGVVELDELATSFNQMVNELSEHRSNLERLVLSRTESLRRSQTDLEKASARLQAAIDSTNNGFLVEDLEGRVAVVNDLFASLMGRGRDELLNGFDGGVAALFSAGWTIREGSTRDWLAIVATGGMIDAELSRTQGDECTLHVFSAPIFDHRYQPVGRVWTVQDLTEQRRLEASLRQSQKMEAVGQLAGGIAHDFNNLLTGILGNLALVETDGEKGAAAENSEHLRCAIRAGERAADLVKQLLGFSRRSRMDLRACDANDVLTEVRDILSATIDPRIRIELDLESAPWRVMADLSLISQVIMNMAVNSKDAMPAGGHLWFRSRNCQIAADDVVEGGERRVGEYMMVSIEDDGEGIPLQIQKRIFEPFFTTKEQGKGTGLGLATSFGIVKQLGGWIEMDSRPGEGTRFDIFLPRSAAAEAQPDKPIAPILTSAPIMSVVRETVLIVDDEDVVRRVAKSLLKKLGYQIIEARDGAEALEIFGARGDEIDLVLLDLTMPTLSGRETFKLLRERHGRVPVLICSGYLVDLTEFAEECGSCPEGFVQKPYRFEDMSAAIEAALAPRRHAA